MYAENLKKIRQSLELSIAKMSKRLNMSASTLTSYERGDRMPSALFITRLYKVFNVNANWFVSGEGRMFNLEEKQDMKTEILAEVKQMFIDKGI